MTISRSTSITAATVLGLALSPAVASAETPTIDQNALTTPDQIVQTLLKYGNESTSAKKQPAKPARVNRGADKAGHVIARPNHGTLSSGFGIRDGEAHNGMDIANDYGTPIYSVMSGTVISAGPATGFGNWVVVKNDDGSKAVYGHMKHFSVQVGQRVDAGEQIAQVGSEGQSTGPHLHFEIYPDAFTPVDPQPWLAARGITF